MSVGMCFFPPSIKILDLKQKNKQTNNAIYLKTKFEWKDKYSFLFGVD